MVETVVSQFRRAEFAVEAARARIERARALPPGEQTDDPRAITPNQVRDQLAAGHATVSGGIYLDVAVGEAGPGDTVRGGGAQASVEVTVQAASWVDVDAIEVIVDGEMVALETVTLDDGEPGNPVVRWHDQVLVDVAPTGSWVVIAAYGNQELTPVHPGRFPFAVSNPIFLER
jgi:hypothetical protein